MISLNGLLAAALALVYSIIPSVSTQRPRTKQQSRGTPVWTSFSNLALKDLNAEASKEIKGQSRSIAFAATSEAQISDAELLAEVLARHAAHYRGLAVVDGLTARRLFGDCKTQRDALAIAREEKIDLVVWCQADDQALTATALTADASAAAPAGLRIDANDNWLAAVAQQPEKLFAALGHEPPAAGDVIAPVPTKNLDAFRQALQASRALYRAIGLKDAAQRARLCDSATASASKAIQSDPDYIEAYLIKASCQDERGQDEAVKQTLRDAYARKNPQVHDALVLHELEGDYAHFCTGDLEAAMSHYTSILEINPSDLRALWALVDIYLTGDGANTPAAEDIAAASDLAARIVVLHPHSAVAQAIQEK